MPYFVLCDCDIIKTYQCGCADMRENLLIDKSIAFAARIIKLHKQLIKTQKETVISKQIVRSGTSIGANINEANYGQSKADFISKMHTNGVQVGIHINPIEGIYPHEQM